MNIERYEYPQPLYGNLNVLRIGDTLVDTGHVTSSREAVRDALADSERLGNVERVVLTHPHIDHVGGSQTIAELASVPHTVFEGVGEIVHDYTTYLREARADMTRLLAGFGFTEDHWNVYFPLGEYNEERIDVTRVVSDGDTVRLGPYDVRVVHTPGHSEQHMAMWHEPSGTCLSVDLVFQNGHFMSGPLYSDVGDYKSSLRRLRNLEPDRLVPMHGYPIENALEQIEACLDNARETEQKVLDWAGERDSFYARQFAAGELGAEDAAAPFLTLVTYEYARHLAERGECEVNVTDDGIRVTG